MFAIDRMETHINIMFRLCIMCNVYKKCEHTEYGKSIDVMREGGTILLSGLTAMLTAVGLVFGLLLALVTGREHVADPLLEMESTGGDVSIELNE